MSETAPPEHVPADQTGWVRLAEVNTRNSPLAIVSALGAQALGKEWDRRYDAAGPGNPDRHELMVNGTEQVQELTITYPWQGVQATDKAVLCSVPDTATFTVYGRFGDEYMSLIELRIRLWLCACVCHDEPGTDEADECDGHCVHE